MKTSKIEQEIERTYQDMLKGMELGIYEVSKRLVSKMDNLTKSELKRVLKTVIEYPNVGKVYTESEKEFVSLLQGLHGLQLQAEIQAIGELQKEQQQKEEKND
jgi:hypothetical protein